MRVARSLMLALAAVAISTPTFAALSFESPASLAQAPELSPSAVATGRLELKASFGVDPLAGCGTTVCRVALNADGTLLMSQDYDGRTALRRVPSGEVVRGWSGGLAHGGIALAGDRAIAFVASGHPELVDVVAGRLAREILVPGEGRSFLSIDLRTTRDGRHGLVIGERRAASRIDLDTGAVSPPIELVNRGSYEGFVDASLSDEGAHAVVALGYGAATRAVLVAFDSGKVLALDPCPGATAVALAPKADAIAVGISENGGFGVLLLDAAGKVVRKIPVRGAVHALAWNAAGTRFAVGLPGAVEVFHRTARDDREVWRVATNDVTALGWSEDGERLAVGGQDGTLFVLGSGTKPIYRSVRVEIAHWELAAGGDRVAGDNRLSDLYVRSADTGALLVRHPFPWVALHKKIVLSTDGRQLGVLGPNSGRFRLTDLASGTTRELVPELGLPPETFCWSDITPDFSRAVISAPGEVFLWDVQKGTAVRSIMKWANGGVERTAISHDGTRVAVARDREVRGWSEAKGEWNVPLSDVISAQIHATNDGMVYALTSGVGHCTINSVREYTNDVRRTPGPVGERIHSAVSPDETLLAIATNGVVEVRSLPGLALVGTLDMRPLDEPLSVAFAPGRERTLFVGTSLGALYRVGVR